MIIKPRYFRIEYYTSDGPFKKFELTDDEQKVKKIMHLTTPDVVIYKCNKNGNNYSGRVVYP